MTSSAFLKSFVGPVRKTLAMSVGLSLAGGFVLIVQSWILAVIINRVLFENAGLQAVWTLMSVLPFLFIARAALAYLAERFAFAAAVDVKQHVRLKLLDHLARLGPVKLAGEGAGDLVNTLSDGVEALESYYARFLPAIAMMVLLPVAILVVVLPFDIISFLTMLLTAPLIPFFMILIGKGTEKLNQQQWRKLARLSGHFLDMIQGLTTLKIFNASKKEAAAIARMSEDYRQSTMQVLRVAFLSSLVLEFFATVSIAMIAVFIGFRLLYGDMAFVHGFFILLLAPEFYLPLRQMGTHYHARMEAIGASERMMDILDLQPAGVDGGGETLLSASPTIAFEGVGFSYEGDRQALRDIDFQIAPGETVALVGPSGAGKSTIQSLLLGFIVPDKGRILIDGKPLDSFARNSWYEKLVYLPQKPTLFPGTIADNIRLGRPDASLLDVKSAAEHAQASEFIERLADGYDTGIGEFGAGLSGGQIQRLAIARAFLCDAPVLLLDEPTSNLDLASEKLVQAALDKLLQERTAIVIAHRLSTTKNADRIMVCDQGRIAEAGSHDSLMRREGLYFRMAIAYSGGQARSADA